MRKQLLAAILIAIGARGAALAEGDTARDLVKKVLDAGPRKASTAKGSLSSTRGWTRDLTLSRKYIGDTNAVFIEVTSPQDVSGTRFLFKEKVEGSDEQYIYIPSVKRVIKVSEDTRKQPFLGSDFYVADLVAPNLESYEYSFVGEDTVGGRKVKLVQALPKDPAKELYAKTIFALDPQDLIVVRMEFFDKDGKPFKVFTVRKMEKIDGIWTPLEQEMVDLQGSTSSTLAVKDVNYNAELSDGMFERMYLLQERN